MKSQEIISSLKESKIGKGCKFLSYGNGVIINYPDFKLAQFFTERNIVRSMFGFDVTGKSTVTFTSQKHTNKATIQITLI